MMPDSARGFRLSPVQRRSWQLGGTDPAFRVQCAVTLAAGVDTARIRESLAEAVAREAIFGARFQHVPGLTTPIQVIDQPGEVAWRDVDLSDSVDPQSLLSQERATAVDFERGPLVHVLCATDRDGTRTLVITVPSLCADAATLAMLVGDMAGHERPSGVSFLQFAEWQNQCAESGEMPEAVGRWTALESQCLVARIAGERPAAAGGFLPRSQSIAPGRGVVQRIRAAADAAGVAPEAWLLACWHLVLRALTGRADVVIGVNAPGRDHASVAGVCGPVSRPIPHRLSVAGGATIAELARAVDADFADVRHWGPYYAAGAHAFPFAFSWEFWPDFRGPGPLVAVSARHVCVERFTLHLTAAWSGDRLALDLGSDSARVPREAVEHIEELLTTLIHGALERPDRTADTIDLLTPQSRRRVLALSAGPSAAVPDGSLARLFDAQAAATPDRLAVVAGRQAMTFRALDGASNRIAQALRRLGAGPDVRIGLIVDRSADVLAGLIGILKAGAAYVPIDPGDPIARWRGLGAGAAIAALVAPAALVAETDPGVPIVRLPLGAAESADDGPIAETAAGSNLAYAIFTSGSSGQPKAVGIEHRSVVNLLGALERAIYRALGGPLRVAINAPLTFDASVKQWIQMLQGHTVCMVPDAIRYDPVAMVPWLSDTRVNVLDCTPAQLRGLIDAGLSDETVPSLEAVLVGGEAIDLALWERLAGSTRIRFHNVYGPTECTVDTTTCPVQPDLEVPVIGRPLAGVHSYVLDRRLELVPIGVAGELFVGGAGLARGYVNAPSLTAERFVPNAFDTTGGSRLYRTGDRVRLLGDGHVEFLDRLDRQIKIRGFRMEPGEIETTLAAHAAVRAATVRTETAPDGLSRMAAYVVVPKGQTLKESDLRAFLRRTLPEFMVPDRIARVDHLPLTAHGKVDAGALAALARPLDRDAPIPPRNDLERTIAEVWRDVLEIDTVGIDDNFFDVGGHSLVLARLHTRLRERLGREFAMVDLFRRPTISSFAAFLAGGAAERWSAAAIADRAARQKQAYRREQALRSKAP